MKIILGSSSKARQEVLRNLGYAFDVISTNIDEKAIRHDDFRKLPLLIAKAKSEELQKLIQEPAILITCDSVVVHNGELREKPIHEGEAREFLKSYSTNPVEIISAVYVVNTGNKLFSHGVDSGKVYFHKIPEIVIEDLIETGHAMTGAGAFQVQDPAIKKYIVHTEGDWDTIMGLSGTLLKKLMKEVLYE